MTPHGEDQAEQLTVLISASQPPAAEQQRVASKLLTRTPVIFLVESYVFFFKFLGLRLLALFNHDWIKQTTKLTSKN